MISEIKNIKDVECFMKQLVAEGTNAHPDEDFNNYVNMESGEPAYTLEEAALRNSLMEQSFDVCDLCGVDVYSVMQEIFLIETGLDKYIPLPSQV
ncbi:hypothetical protein [Mucilaginibacter lappiensis]|uniref:Uncharacterized protein n=1 Tax=Mucilaginibacter lappiensis TaxID=354630 RepID=A0A841JIW0_9SPHI|nr:hypothetical protein [Mucilaginibacter lappiensis]MBB6128628.1 hypothetical protein [Mucilaginibacter lappiensis]